MRIKWILLVLLVVLVGIFIAENLSLTEYAFLGWRVSLPRYQVAIGLVAAGFFMGLLVVPMRRRKRKISKRVVPSEEGQEEETEESDRSFS